MSPIAAEFVLKYPEVEVEVVASNRRVNIVEEGFDVAVFFMGVNEDSSLVARKLESTELRCCASPSYVAARGVPSEPEDLAAHTCIVYGETRQTTWRFERGSETRPVSIHGRMSVNSFMMAHDAVKRGVGIASLPTFLCGEDLRTGRLVPLLADWLIDRTEMRVVYPSSRYLAPRVRLFVEALITGYNESIDRYRVLGHELPGTVRSPVRSPPRGATRTTKTARAR
jgi:DNA-binding transcriptional LysR family regulator